ncbi:MAG: hypothetical protein AB1810_08070 [Pseudomonadota bacterium]
MIQLLESRKARATPEFATVLKRELEALALDQLPLQQALARGNQVLDDKCTVLILSVDEGPEVIRAKVGVFFSSIIAGCSCADDPTPVEAITEYCEMWVELDARTGMAIVGLAE